MNERVSEIVTYLIRQILHEEAGIPTGPEIVQNLVNQGYCISEIDAAFSLIFSLPDNIKPGHPNGPLRVFNRFESVRIAPEAQNHLVSLRTRGLIKEDEFEQVVLSLLYGTDEVAGLEELRQALHEVIHDEGRAFFLEPAGPDVAQHEGLPH